MEYTEEEIKELKEEIGKIDTFLPENKTSYVWNWYKRITGSLERQPCSCGSSAKHWNRALTSIREFLQDK